MKFRALQREGKAVFTVVPRVKKSPAPKKKVKGKKKGAKRRVVKRKVKKNSNKIYYRLQ